MSSLHCMSQLLWFIFNKVSSQCSWPLTGQKAWNPVANLHDRSHISWILEWSQTMHFKFHVLSFVLELSGIVLFQTFIHCQDFTHCVPFFKKRKELCSFSLCFFFVFFLNFSLFWTVTAKQEKKNWIWIRGDKIHSKVSRWGWSKSWILWGYTLFALRNF